MAQVVEAKKMPKRLKFKLVSNGERLKIFSDEDIGGSYLAPSKIMDEVLRSGRIEGYADFVEDSDNWRKRNTRP